MADTTLRSPLARVPRPRRLLHEFGGRWRPPTIPQDAVNTLLRERGMGPAVRTRTAGSGWRNRTVIVSTPNDRVVVKRYRTTATPATLSWEHSILEHLASRGVAVTRLVADATGATFTELDGGWYAVFAHTAGRTLAGCYLTAAGRIRAVSMAGVALARLHVAGRGFAPAGSHPLGFDATGGRPRRGVDWYVERLGLLAANPPPVSDPASYATHRRLADRVGPIGDELRKLDARLAGLDLPITIVHGDFGLHNLIYPPTGLPAVHDFELARVDRRIVDVVDSVARLGVTDGRTFLAAYAGGVDLTADEERHLVDVWRHVRLTGGVRSWATFLERGDDRRLATASRRIDEAFGPPPPALASFR